MLYLKKIHSKKNNKDYFVLVIYRNNDYEEVFISEEVYKALKPILKEL